MRYPVALHHNKMADADGPAGKRRRVDNHVADAAVACGIAVGSQLEVQWDLASDDGGTEQKWWETSILAKDGTTQLEKDNAEDAHAADGGGAIEHGDEDLPATHAQCYTLQYVFISQSILENVSDCLTS